MPEDLFLLPKPTISIQQWVTSLIKQLAIFPFSTSFAQHFLKVRARNTFKQFHLHSAQKPAEIWFLNVNLSVRMHRRAIKIRISLCVVAGCSCAVLCPIDLFAWYFALWYTRHLYKAVFKKWLLWKVIYEIWALTKWIFGTVLMQRLNFFLMYSHPQKILSFTIRHRRHLSALKINFDREGHCNQLRVWEYKCAL